MEDDDDDDDIPTVMVGGEEVSIYILITCIIWATISKVQWQLCIVSFNIRFGLVISLYTYARLKFMRCENFKPFSQICCQRAVSDVLN